MRDKRPCVVYEFINASSRHLREARGVWAVWMGGVANADTRFRRRKGRTLESSRQKRNSFQVHLAAVFQSTNV